MSMSRVLVCLLFAAVVLSGITYAVTPDRIPGDLASGAKVALKGNVHGLARAQFDLGRADSSRLMQGISLAFRPSTEQQKDLNQFIAELGDGNSPNYHKYLTPAQFGERFGLSLSDIAKVSTWLHVQGFRNIRVANGRNQISFDGTVGQIESVFAVEMHNYGVNGAVHLANAGEPSIPAALSGTVLGVGSLNDFAPKPRAKVQSHLTSYVTGNHFLTPADFATIYDLNALYAAGADGTGQTIAIVGQTDIDMTDVNNFRTNSSLPGPANVTKTLVPSTSASTTCGGDEGESDLDIEWSGGIAKNAQIVFVYAGLNSGDTCDKRNNNVWNALQYAVDNNVAPFISTSYGYCESGLGRAFALQVQQWAQQGITQGQTIVAASGDEGAADCESSTATTATKGLAVDVPASIPEVTGAGGNEFTGDNTSCATSPCPGNLAPADPPYWTASNTGSDAVSSALQHIPEKAWNDNTQSLADTSSPGFSASGGGASIFFSKPAWQIGTGVPADAKRDVPDISINASNFHDSYLVCSHDGVATPCASGFRDSAGGSFFAVGGTSASAPTFTALLALINQFVGNTPPKGLAPINPTLYQLSPFYDVTQGDNMVPCTNGTTSCTAGSMGFKAGPGYDQVTGLGSPDGYGLAQAWAASEVAQSFSLTSSSAGATVSLTPGQTSSGIDITVTSPTGFVITTGSGSTTAMPVNYSCSGLPGESTCNFSPPTPTSAVKVTLTIKTTAPTARLQRPFDRGGMFYALLLPGLFGVVFTMSGRRRFFFGMRFLGLITFLGFSTIWLASCGGTSGSSNKNPGTPPGTYQITVNAVTSGQNPVTASPPLSFKLSVTQ
jgi:subtilase family serine protease